MPSLIPGFEYDIFISYRHKDNKYDGWVSEFVANLRKELDATFKEDISIYFDENPHDGLLETHNVDKSLESKLKCLILIPILSQTYCDAKSFAWTNEFIAFRDYANKDPFGLNIKLLNGNVVSRILPVRIHDLESPDKSLFERETQSALRSIDFIFKGAGVNRPLRAKDDDVKEITHTTFYRDQINKVANAIKDIITCFSRGSIGHTSKGNFTPAANEYSTIQVRSKFHSSDQGLFASLTKKLKTSNWMAISLILMTFLAGVLVLWILQIRDNDNLHRKPTHSSIILEASLSDVAAQFPCFAISPDGRTVAYSGERGIVVRSLSGFTSKLLEGTTDATLVAFSPDSRNLAFGRAGGIYKTGLFQSAPSVILKSGVGAGISWGEDGNIYYGAALGSGGIWKVSANGSEPVQVTVVNDSLGEVGHTWPQFLPGSNSVLFTALGASGGHLDSRIMIQPLGSPKPKVLIDKAIFGRYLPNGYIVCANNEGILRAYAFDQRKQSTTGEPEVVLTGMCTSSWGGAAYLSVSETGDLVFLPRQGRPINALYVFDQSGKLISTDSIPQSVLVKMGHGWTGLNISPSGDFIAVNGRTFGSSDIWVLNLKTKDAERITFDVAEDEFPVWASDENFIAYTSAHTGNTRRLFIVDLKRRAAPRRIMTWPRHVHFYSWSRDNNWLTAYDFSATNGLSCWAISIDSTKVISVANSKANETYPVFSPDGRWIAYQSDESGRYEVYIVSFPDLQYKRQISIDGGIIPRWDRDGKTIYYQSEGYLIAHPLDAAENVLLGKPNRLFLANALDFNVSPDGKKIYIMKRERQSTSLSLITNWFHEFSTPKEE